jgi:hypothetical protein
MLQGRGCAGSPWRVSPSRRGGVKPPKAVASLLLCTVTCGLNQKRIRARKAVYHRLGTVLTFHSNSRIDCASPKLEQGVTT